MVQPEVTWYSQRSHAWYSQRSHGTARGHMVQSEVACMVQSEVTWHSRRSRGTVRAHGTAGGHMVQSRGHMLRGLLYTYLPSRLEQGCHMDTRHTCLLQNYSAMRHMGPCPPKGGLQPGIRRDVCNHTVSALQHKGGGGGP